MEFLEIYTYKFMSFVTRDSFFIFQGGCLLFIYFSCLIALARTSNTALKRSGECIIVLLMILKGKILPFSPEYGLSCEVFIYGLSYTEFPSILSLLSLHF